MPAAEPLGETLKSVYWSSRAKLSSSSSVRSSNRKSLRQCFSSTPDISLQMDVMFGMDGCLFRCVKVLAVNLEGKLFLYLP